jgi:hypothetical protein
MEHKQLSERLETSIELIDALAEVAAEERPLQDIWAEPTEREFEDVLHIAFGNTEKSELSWGCLIVTRDGIQGVSL